MFTIHSHFKKVCRLEEIVICNQAASFVLFPIIIICYFSVNVSVLLSLPSYLRRRLAGDHVYANAATTASKVREDGRGGEGPLDCRFVLRGGIQAP